MKKIRLNGVTLIILGCILSLISYIKYDGYAAMILLIIGVILFIVGSALTPKIRKIIGIILEILWHS